MLEEAGLPSKAGNIGAFRSVLKTLKIHVPEDIKLPDEQTQRTITKKLGKISALNIEDFLSGRKLGPLMVTGKEGFSNCGGNGLWLGKIKSDVRRGL